MNLKNKIELYKKENKLTDEKCAENLGISIETLTDIKNDCSNISSKEQSRILNVIDPKAKGRKIIKILDLIFRFLAMVMALTTLLLCINENVDTKALIILLSIGLVCSSMTILPKIEK